MHHEVKQREAFQWCKGLRPWKPWKRVPHASLRAPSALVNLPAP